jgi:hypothetical protein
VTRRAGPPLAAALLVTVAFAADPPVSASELVEPFPLPAREALRPDEQAVPPAEPAAD